jgi:hypothetical protein
LPNSKTSIITGDLPMVTVNSETGAKLIVDDEVAHKYGLKRGSPPVSDDELSVIRKEQLEARVVGRRIEAPTPLPDEKTEVVLVNIASLP